MEEDPATPAPVEKVTAESIFTPAQCTLALRVRCEGIKLSLRDDTGVFEYPVLTVSLRSLEADALVTLNKPMNIIQQTLKMLCLAEKPDEPYLKVKARGRIEASYFNMLVAAYEPLIEPWRMELEVLQEEEDQPMDAELALPDLLNLNLTLGMAHVLKRLQ